MKKNVLTYLLCLVGLACLLLLPRTSVAQVDSDPITTPVDFTMQNKTSQPQVTATNYIVVDLGSGQILIQKNPHEQKAPASLTKLLTALVVLDELDLNQEVTVSANASNMEPSKIKLQAGEVITVENLLSGMLIASGNDAAVALAEAVSGTSDDFAKLMNEKAKELGLTDSLFKNPAGIDQDGHTSSVSDIARLSIAALGNPFVAETVRTKSKTIYSVNRAYSHYLRSTNQLLAVDGVIGVKTGSTDQAGQTLSFLVARDGRKVLVVMFNSQNRFADGKIFIDWIFSQQTWSIVKQPICTIDFPKMLLTPDFSHIDCQTNEHTIVIPKI